jgi:hypothetical protein
LEITLPYFVFASESDALRCDTLGAAITEACRRLNSGAAVLRIKGSDGLVMERSDVLIECERRQSERNMGEHPRR